MKEQIAKNEQKTYALPPEHERTNSRTNGGHPVATKAEAPTGEMNPCKEGGRVSHELTKIRCD